MDGSGYAYVTGRTQSTDFDVTSGAYQTTFGGGYIDVFVTKLCPGMNLAVCVPLSGLGSTLEGRVVEGGGVELRWRADVPAVWARLERLQGGVWVPVYRHEGAGSRSFVWVDRHPSFREANVYRVVSGHEGGDVVYSNVVSVEVGDLLEVMEAYVEVYPNPVREEVRYRIELREGGMVFVRVYDRRGRVVWQEGAWSGAGVHEGRLDVAEWAEGVYVLQVEYGGRVEAVRFHKAGW